MLEQKNTVTFASADKKQSYTCDNDTPLGNIHDFLMYLKGMIVEKMVEAQKQEQAAAEAMKQQDSIEE